MPSLSSAMAVLIWRRAAVAARADARVLLPLPTNAGETTDRVDAREPNKSVPRRAAPVLTPANPSAAGPASTATRGEAARRTVRRNIAFVWTNPTSAPFCFVSCDFVFDSSKRRKQQPLYLPDDLCIRDPTISNHSTPTHGSAFANRGFVASGLQAGQGIQQACKQHHLLRSTTAAFSFSFLFFFLDRARA